MEPTVEIPVAKGLQKMIRGDGVASRQISDSSCDLEDAVIGTGAEVQIGHGVFQQLIAPVIQSAMLLQLCMAHAGIAGRFSRFRKAMFLNLPGLHDSRPDGGGRFCRHGVSKFLVGERMVSLETAKRLVDLWLSTPFESGRYVNRIEELARYEAAQPMQ